MSDPEARRPGHRLVVCVLSSLVALSIAAVSAKATGVLLQASDLHLLGAFHVPKGIHSGGQANAGFEYGGTALCKSPNGLYMVGHMWDQFMGEISIPALGGTATLLQPLVDPSEGKLGQINPTDPNSKRIGGCLVANGALLFTGYSFYDGNNSQVLSHFARPLSLSTRGPVVGPLRVGPLGAGFYSGYMGVVDPAWTLTFGGPVLTGNASIPVISRTSLGPAASTFDPAHVDGKAKPLVGYPIDHAMLGAYGQSNPLYGGADTVTGVVMPVGTGTVLFFGTHGTTFCYGPGTSDKSKVGKIDPAQDPIDAYCYDPAVSSKGQHGYPYVPQVWAYDANALADVAAGHRQPWDVKPYAVWTLPIGSDIGGAAYDPSTQRIFISERFADGENPLVHVFAVGDAKPAMPSDTVVPQRKP